jgi:hypothetical protein
LAPHMRPQVLVELKVDRGSVRTPASV